MREMMETKRREETRAAPRRLRAALFLAAVGVVVPAAAETMKLDEARRAALAASETVKQAALAVNSLKLGEKSAAAGFLPSLSADAGISGSVADSAIATTTRAGLSASQPLFSGGAKIAALKSAQKESGLAEAQLSSARLAALAELDTRFLNALETASTYEADLEDLKAAELRLRIAEAKREAGALSEIDYLSALSTWASAKTTATQTKYSANAARRTLSSYLGQDVEPSVPDDAIYDRIVAALRVEAENNFDAFALSLYAQAADFNPDIAQKRLSVDIAALAVATSRADFFPSVTASASYSTSVSDGTVTTSDPTFGLTASIPLFPISDRSAAVSAAKNDVAVSRSALALEEEDLRLSVYTKTLDILSAADRIQSAEAAVSYAERNYELALEKFKLSALSASELADAEATLSTARLQAITSRFDLYTATGELARLLGLEDEAALADELS